MSFFRERVFYNTALSYKRETKMTAKCQSKSQCVYYFLIKRKKLFEQSNSFCRFVEHRVSSRSYHSLIGRIDRIERSNDKRTFTYEIFPTPTRSTCCPSWFVKIWSRVFLGKLEIHSRGRKFWKIVQDGERILLR